LSKQLGVGGPELGPAGPPRVWVERLFGP